VLVRAPALPGRVRAPGPELASRVPGLASPGPGLEWPEQGLQARGQAPARVLASPGLEPEWPGLERASGQASRVLAPELESPARGQALGLPELAQAPLVSGQELPERVPQARVPVSPERVLLVPERVSPVQGRALLALAPEQVLPARVPAQVSAVPSEPSQARKRESRGLRSAPSTHRRQT
jgi:hypothetical protein